MGFTRFGRPKGAQGQSSPNLYVANCGPAVGLSYDTIVSVFGAFGEIKGVFAADESGARVVVCFAEEGCAQNAFNALNGRPCAELGGRSLHIRYSVLQPTSQSQVLSLCVGLLDLNFIVLAKVRFLRAVGMNSWNFLILLKKLDTEY